MGNQQSTGFSGFNNEPKFKTPKSQSTYFKDLEGLLKISASGTTRSGEDVLAKTHVITSIDDRDKDTPDNWVGRSKQLIRLTGKHPFNCEPKLETLFDQGFITPVSIHYVRSHGRVPPLKWKTHKVKVTGLVSRPRSFSMDEIVKMPTVTMPVTLTCAGNRRKEENMIKQTRGFNWGAAATSTSVWTGVKLLHLLNLSGIDLSKALHVRFHGSTKEELPPGSFGSSVNISTAMSIFSDILIAYKQNGELLHPDHGFPVRVIIPGWVGARMVKWLDEIEISTKVSESHYHYFDNRIFPSFVDAQMADEEGYWYNELYVFNELNVNSVIVHPRDGEVFEVQDGYKYNVSGYAYSGGGRMITRVEVSLDGGSSWRLAELDYPEEKYSHAPKYGFYYCWMFWNLELQMDEIFDAAKSAGEIRVRAWDASNNTQPAHIIWNLLGYGNNCHFVVKMEVQDRNIFFSHPTVAGASSSGWMKASGDKSALGGTDESLMKKVIPMSEIANHNNRESTWIVIDGKVYDATEYLDDHPGGSASILVYGGQDASDDFNEIHSDSAKAMLKKFQIGIVGHEEDVAVAEISSETVSRGPSALITDEWVDFELMSVEKISKIMRKYKYKLHNEAQSLGLPVGGHILVKAVVNGKTVLRPYTVISSEDDKGFFELGIKVYYPSKSFPDGGKMSQYMDRMNVGDKLSVSGPFGKIEYKGSGVLHVYGKDRKVKNIGFVCGGTGITPAYQVLMAAYKDSSEKTNMWLLYGCREEDEILMRKEIDEMSKKRSDIIKVWYTLDQANWLWRYSTGYVTEDMIKKNLPTPGNDTLILLCGPSVMIDRVVLPYLQKLGHKDENIAKF